MNWWIERWLDEWVKNIMIVILLHHCFRAQMSWFLFPPFSIYCFFLMCDFIIDIMISICYALIAHCTNQIYCATFESNILFSYSHLVWQPKFAAFAKEFGTHSDAYKAIFDSVEPHRYEWPQFITNLIRNITLDSRLPFPNSVGGISPGPASLPVYWMFFTAGGYNEWQFWACWFGG